MVAAYSSDVPTWLLDPSVVNDSIHVVARFLWASTSYSCELHAKFNNAWLSGSRSIILPSGSKHQYPLWVAMLLTDLTAAHARIDAWEAARHWLEAVSETDPACPALATNVLFSLASLKSLITVQNMSMDGTITQLVTLPSLAIQIFKSVKSKQGHVRAVVKTLCQLLEETAQRNGLHYLGVDGAGHEYRSA
jgi:hypothetical protein